MILTCKVVMIMRNTPFAALVAAAAMSGLCLAPLHAAGQIPAGMDPAAVQQMLPSEISVPAGQTTSVDIGVPVSVNYTADGWVVSSNGSTISVTAPNTPGATAPVTASAGGISAAVTLVAVGGEAVGDDQPAAPAPQGSEQGGVARPERAAAAPVDTSQAKRLYFDAEIDGNSIIVRVPLSQAADLLPYSNVNHDGAKVRYLDINGKIIEGVTRDVDVAGRKLTLTYPDGQVPDNPFIIEVVRDDSRAEFIAVLTATNAPVAQVENEQASPYSEISPEGQDDEPDVWKDPITWMWIAAGVMLLVGAVLIARDRRKRNTR